jgi:hypothetical protein
VRGAALAGQAADRPPAAQGRTAAAPPTPRPHQSLCKEPPSSPSAADPIAWTAFDRSAAVRDAARAALGWDEATFAAALANLAALLPDLPSRLPRLPPPVLAAALAGGPTVTAARLVALKGALPGTNVGALLLAHPPLLHPGEWPSERLLAGVAHAERTLGGRAAAEEVLQWYPPLLDPALLDAAVAQLRRLVPRLAEQLLPPQGPAGDAAVGGSSGDGAGAGAASASPGGQGGGAPQGVRAEPGQASPLVHLLGIGLKGVRQDGSVAVWFDG